MIAKQAIEEHGEKYTLILGGNQTADELAKQFQASGYPENSTWVVVSLEDGQYGVIRLARLSGILSRIGDVALTLRLADLPIALVDEVIPQETPRSTGEVLDEIANSPGITVAVTDADGFAGLFTNPTMGGEGGLVCAQSYLELHGELAKIKDKQSSTVPYPRCPHCGYNESFYTYDIASKTFVCQKCGEVTERL